MASAGNLIQVSCSIFLPDRMYTKMTSATGQKWMRVDGSGHQHIDLVGGLEHFLFFPYIGNVIIPIDGFSYFSEV